MLRCDACGSYCCTLRCIEISLVSARRMPNKGQYHIVIIINATEPLSSDCIKSGFSSSSSNIQQALCPSLSH